MAIADDALAVDEEGLGRAVNPEIQPQHAVRIVEIDLIGIAELRQPLDGLVPLILVVHADDGNALPRQLLEVGVLPIAGRAPGGPDVEQHGAPLEDAPVMLLVEVVDVLQGEHGHLLVHHHGFQLGGVGVEPLEQEHGAHQEDDEGQQKQPGLLAHALLSSSSRRPKR
ncbi:hypothetical protein D3C84_915430 [compost metagenome]